MRRFLSATLLASTVAAVLGRALEGSDVCSELPAPEYAPEGLYPVTALASFQGSGNTWMRLLLAQLTGIKVGDTYHSIGNDQIAEFSSRSDSTVVAVKTHHYDVSLVTQDGVNPFERAIVIVRHPLNSLLAEFNRLYGGNKTGYADPAFFFNPDGSTTWKWDLWLTRLVVWIEFHEYWINRYRKPVHVVSYNGLKKDLRTELIELVRFLGVPLNETRLNCTVDHHSAMFVRDRKRARLSRQQLELLFELALDRSNRAVHAVRQDIWKRWAAVDTGMLERLDVAPTYD